VREQAAAVKLYMSKRPACAAAAATAWEAARVDGACKSRQDWQGPHTDRNGAYALL
jgi:hypothetical protein